jgi:hypothetical protein
MIRKLLSIAIIGAIAICYVGCSEDEHKMTQKSETQTESAPKDKSPGEMTP